MNDGSSNAEEAPKNYTPIISAIVGVLVVAFGVGIFFVACSGGKGRAKDDFAASFTCPPDRIEIRARNDISGSMFVERRPPSAEVKSDPARLAIWNKQEDERVSSADSGGNYGKYYWQVRGCGHDQLYECSNKPSCRSRSFPAGASSAW
jgi:hypothetical protein